MRCANCGQEIADNIYMDCDSSFKYVCDDCFNNDAVQCCEINGNRWPYLCNGCGDC